MKLVWKKVRIKADPVAAAALRLWKKLDPKLWKHDPHVEEPQEIVEEKED